MVPEVNNPISIAIIPKLPNIISVRAGLSLLKKKAPI